MSDEHTTEDEMSQQGDEPVVTEVVTWDDLDHQSCVNLERILNAMIRNTPALFPISFNIGTALVVEAFESALNDVFPNKQTIPIDRAHDTVDIEAYYSPVPPPPNEPSSSNAVQITRQEVIATARGEEQSNVAAANPAYADANDSVMGNADHEHRPSSGATHSDQASQVRSARVMPEYNPFLNPGPKKVIKKSRRGGRK